MDTPTTRFLRIEPPAPAVERPRRRRWSDIDPDIRVWIGGVLVGLLVAFGLVGLALPSIPGVGPAAPAAVSAPTRVLPSPVAEGDPAADVSHVLQITGVRNDGQGVG